MNYTLQMSMGKRGRERQPEMWVATDEFSDGRQSPILHAIGPGLGLPPGMYFRLLLIGYFEGIDSERGIAWHAARLTQQSWRLRVASAVAG